MSAEPLVLKSSELAGTLVDLDNNAADMTLPGLTGEVSIRGVIDVDKSYMGVNF